MLFERKNFSKKFFQIFFSKKCPLVQVALCAEKKKGEGPYRSSVSPKIKKRCLGIEMGLVWMLDNVEY